MLTKRKNSFYAACAIIWSALVDKDHDFESPEDLAEYLKEDEQQSAAIRAISSMINEAFPEKKSPLSESSSSTGQGPSLKPESEQPAQITGTSHQPS